MKALLITFLLTGICQGRIGKTLEQCAQRYGDVTRRSEPAHFLPAQHVFKWNGIRVAVMLNEDGRCMRVTYSAPSDTPLTKDQVREFLALNRGSGIWKQSTHPTALKLAWKNNKLGLHAVLTEKSEPDNHLSITSADYRAYIRDLDWKIRHTPKK